MAAESFISAAETFTTTPNNNWTGVNIHKFLSIKIFLYRSNH